VFHPRVRLLPACAAGGDTERPTPLTGWDGDLREAADLLAASYAPETARQLTPTGTADDWRTYLQTLMDESPCGAFEPSLSLMVRDGQGLAAIAIVTSIDADVVHLAQLVVRPDVGRRGIGTAMLNAAMARASVAGFRAMTLFVHEANAPALRLYDRLGFARCAAAPGVRARR
jgi:ribosomal protein S18 acetylase RimI-like enzyme